MVRVFPCRSITGSSGQVNRLRNEHVPAPLEVLVGCTRRSQGLGSPLLSGISSSVVSAESPPSEIPNDTTSSISENIEAVDLLLMCSDGHRSINLPYSVDPRHQVIDNHHAS